MEPSELKSLLQQYLAGTISGEDFRRLWETHNKPASEQDWLAAIQEAISTEPSGFSDADQANLALAKIKAKVYCKGILHFRSPEKFVYLELYRCIKKAFEIFYFRRLMPVSP